MNSIERAKHVPDNFRVRTGTPLLIITQLELMSHFS